jgi:hypothetical protein
VNTEHLHVLRTPASPVTRVCDFSIVNFQRPMVSTKPADYETKLLMDMRPNFGFKDVWEPGAWRVYIKLCDDAPPMLLIHYCQHGKVTRS